MLFNSEVTFHNLKEKLIATLGVQPKKIKSNLERYMYPMLILELFTIAKIWRQPRCPLINKRIKRMWYTCTMKYYTAIKKNEILPSVTTWVDPEGTVLTEVRQRKTNTIWFHLYVESKNKIITDSQKQRPKGGRGWVDE